LESDIGSVITRLKPVVGQLGRANAKSGASANSRLQLHCTLPEHLLGRQGKLPAWRRSDAEAEVWLQAGQSDRPPELAADPVNRQVVLIAAIGGDAAVPAATANRPRFRPNDP